MLRVLSELRTVIAVRAKETEERERSALLRQNPAYKFEEMESAECVMSRTINYIGLASEEWHIPAVNAKCPVNARNSETVLQSSDEKTGVDHIVSSVTYNSDPVSEVDDASCLYTKHIALMAVAKSQQMVTMSEDTFGDDEEGDVE